VRERKSGSTAAAFCTLRLAIVFCCSTAGAAPELYLSQNARTFEMQQSSLIIKGMAHACLTSFHFRDSLPCNPSLLPFNGKPRLGAQAALSNGYSTLERMRNLINGQLSDEMITELFSKARVLQIEANAEIDFISNYFAAKYTPINLKYFSVIRNEANPDVELSAVEEKNVELQFGYPISENFYVGLEAKSISRRFVINRFQLVDLATEDGKAKLKPKTQQGILFSPAATVFFPGEWRPRVALKVANIGSFTGYTEALAEPIDVQTGGGVTIPLGWTELDVSVDYRSLTYEERWEERFHLGSMLRFGAMALVSGVDYYGLSGGVFYGLEQVNAGILFSTTQAPWNSNDYYANTVYLQIGWQI